jgi:AcrR family transcriptional regulator
VPRRAKIRPDEPGRERLLDAGRELFGTRGYEATSIADIGRRAGIAKSVLYHYFGSKSALYEELVRHDADALVAAVAAAVPPRAGEGPRLRPGVDAFLRFLSEHPGTWRLSTRDPPADPALRALHERTDREVATALRELLAMPAKVQAKPDVVELVALAVRAYARWWQDHPSVPREDIVDAIGDFAAAAARRIGAG